MICAGCSNKSELQSAPLIYQGIPAGLMARCTVQDVPLETTRDIIESRRRYKDAYEKCAAKMDAIRQKSLAPNERKTNFNKS